MPRESQTNIDVGVLGTLVKFSSVGFHHSDYFKKKKKSQQL